MAFLQGNTYLKPVQVLDGDGNVIKANRVVKGEFVFGDLYKYYGDGGEVIWSSEANAFIVPLTEEDTFSLEGVVECQARLVLDDGSVSGSVPEGHYVYTSKSKTRLTEGGAGEQSGELLQIKLLKELGAGGSGGSGGTTDYNDLDNKPSINGVQLVGNKTATDLGIVSKEIDPTVPNHVKNITEQDIRNWNNKSTFSGNYNDLTNKPKIPVVPTNISAFNNDAGYIKSIPSEYVTEGELSNKGYATRSDVENAVKDKATTSYVDGKVAELVNSAPEMLDTLGELAKAVEDNKDIIDGIKVPTKTSELTNDSGFVTIADVPSTDLSGYYTKSETEAYVQSQIASSITEVLNTEVQYE